MRSSLEKMVASCHDEKSLMWGAPQDRQSPAVFLGTICRREDQALDEGHMIPS